MAKIPNLADLSRFVDKDHPHPIKVHNTVNLLIGEQVIVVNGIVISQRSKVLLQLVSTSSDVYMDEFVDDIKGVQDCINLLYGGAVVITRANIQTIVKFGIKFEVHPLYQISLDWIRSNVCVENVYLLITTGLMEQQMSNNNEILKVCTGFIAGHVQNDLCELSRNWSFTDHALIRFLLQAEIMSFTLPVITAWIDTDSDIRLILDELETKEGIMGETELAKHREKTSLMMKKMNQKVQSLETSKRIVLVLSNSLLEVPPVANLKSLLSQNYALFTADQLVQADKDFQLGPFEFIDVILHWLLTNIPSFTEFERIWQSVKVEKRPFWPVDGRYFNTVENTIRSIYPKWTPEVEALKPGRSCSSRFWSITHPSTTLAESSKRVYLTDIQVKFLLSKLIMRLNIQCGKCGEGSEVKLQLDDIVPRFATFVDAKNTHRIMVQHWCLEWRYCGRWCTYSLITNSFAAIVAKVDGCRENNIKIGLRCLFDYQCHVLKKCK